MERENHHMTILPQSGKAKWVEMVTSAIHWESLGAMAGPLQITNRAPQKDNPWVL